MGTWSCSLLLFVAAVLTRGVGAGRARPGVSSWLARAQRRDATPGRGFWPNWPVATATAGGRLSKERKSTKSKGGKPKAGNAKKRKARGAPRKGAAKKGAQPAGAPLPPLSQQWEELRKAAGGIQDSVSGSVGELREQASARAAHASDLGARQITSFVAGVYGLGGRIQSRVSATRARAERAVAGALSTAMDAGGAVVADGMAAKNVKEENDQSVRDVLDVINSYGWEKVVLSGGVTVERKFMPPPGGSGGGNGKGAVVDAAAAAKFACVKASGTLDAPADDVYKLFLSNDRVQEYNENCREVKDLQFFGRDTKVTWAASPRYGPFKARDFVTVVHYRKLSDGTLVVVNRPVEHPKAPRRDNKYVRAEILIATNMMRPNPADPAGKTDFISVTHINPGGIVDSPIGAKITNALCAQAPVKLLRGLERAAAVPGPGPAAAKAAKRQ